MTKTKPKQKPRPKPKNIQTLQKPVQSNWLACITDDSVRLAIPVGPGFQANVPDWSGHNGDNEVNTSRWLGTRIWPIRGSSQEINGNVIGKGRPDSCPCITPGSIECVKQHVIRKRIQLQDELGTVFWKWRFDNMGEYVSKLWSLDEQKRFALLVKMNTGSQGKSFLKLALENLPSHSVQGIVSYYFNVYIPRRITIQTRTGCTIVDTDEDEDEADEDAPCSKGSRKRCQADSITSSGSKYVKTRYLTGRR